KWVHFLYAAAGITLMFLLIKTGQWVWSYFAKPKDLIIFAAAAAVAGGGGWIAWRHEELFTLASGGITELAKVTWPTRRETMMATLVVIVTVVIASSFLGLFDTIWSKLTQLLYG